IARGLSAEERRALDAWLGSDPLHPETLLSFARFWDETAIASELAELFPLERYCPAPRRRRTARWAVAAAAACAAALLAIAVVPRLDGPADGDAVRRYETLVGGQSTVHLPDGSAVTLNTDSAVEVRYTAAERALVLERGEAYFEAARDPARACVVRAGGRALRALGTAFNGRIGPEEQVWLMVTEGVVGVLTETADVAAEVAAGGIATIATDDLRVEDPGVDAVRARLGWQRGMLSFDGEPLEAVLAEMSRYTTVELVADESIRDVRVGGYFRAGDVDGLLFALRESFGIESH